MAILLIDDDGDFRDGLAANLRDDGYAVQEYAAPAEVPSQLAGIEVAITDYSMPGENGLSFARRFHRSHPQIPVVMVTAYSTHEIEEEVAASGFITLLNKPLRYEELQRLVAKLGVHRT